MKTLKSIHSAHLFQSFALAIAILLPASIANAAPYASGVTNDGANLSFVVNESADSVKVIFDSGTVTNDLGALAKGTQVVALNGATNFQIVVYKASAAGYTTGPGAGGTATALQISSDTNSTVNFFVPKGVAVNHNPKSPYFGRIYVADDLGGLTTVHASRTTTTGIFALNADQTDAIGQGNTGQTGGLTFGAANDNSPYKLRVGEDDNLYINDWSDSSGNLYRMDPNLTATAGVFALQQLTNYWTTNANAALCPVGTGNNHGSLASCWVTGSTNNGDLKIYTIDEDLQSNKTTGTKNQLNSLWVYNVNAGALPDTSNPTRLWTAASGEGINSSSQVMDLYRAPDGKFFITTARSAGSESGLIVRDSTGSGSTLFNSKTMTTSISTNLTDFLKNSSSVAVTDDGKWVAVQTGNTSTASDNKTWIMPLTNSIPDLSKRNVLTTFTTLVSRQVAFDAAGNLYGVNNGTESMRIFSPGGTTIATTGGDLTGTNGTFGIVTVDPGISTQPVSSTNNAGVTVTLAVTATGTSAFTYQWQKNGTNVASATKSSLALANLQQSSAGTYLVRVTNALGSFIVSSNAIITVTDTLPIITVQPTNTTVACGSNVNFRIGTTGTDTRLYQWFFNGTAISSATASSYTRNNMQAADNGSYQVTITNNLGSATSVVAIVTVTNTLPIITTQPAGRTNGAGTNVTLSVTTLGTDARLWQWFFNGSAISGATASSYVQNNIQTNASGTYQVTITNDFGSTTSAIVTLLITNRGPVITTQPASKTVNAGSNVVFSVSAQGTTNLSYQWSYNAGAIGGATASSYTVSNAQQANAGSYSVSITNDFGSNNSANATLTVVDIAPVITSQPQSVSATSGDPATFSVTATGTTPFTYQWKKDGGNIANATTSSFSIASAQAGDAGSYSVGVTNSIGGTISSNAVLTVVASTQFKIQSINGATLTNVVITWHSASGTVYRVQYSAGLDSTNWNNLSPDISATGDSASFTNNAGVNFQRYYRILQLP